MDAARDLNRNRAASQHRQHHREELAERAGTAHRLMPAGARNPALMFSPDWTRLSPMKTCNIHEAKTHFSRLVDAAAAGEEIVIAKAGKPVAKLVPVSASRGARQLGALAGKVREAPDCWEPEASLEELFYAAPAEPAPPRRVADRKAATSTKRKRRT